ncbi:MAG: FG-GAP-like repeat-containing protein [Microscillaceae bacterium]|nr:FG-GAP-like repeat-containing protein [Microscillaceae bacterium]
MKNLILDQYRNAVKKYRKFAFRLQKKRLNGAFKELSINKQKHVIALLQKLKARLLELRHKMTLAGLGVFLGTSLILNSAKAQVKFELPKNPIQLGEDDVPFGISVGPSPAFADLDNDADLDLFLGLPDGAILFYKNNGASGFTRDDASNPLASINTAYGYAQPTFADWDKDGDLDLFLGGYGIKYFQNTGTNAQPVFTEITGTANPLNAVSNAYISKPVFADIDGDSDLDVVVGFGAPNPISGSGMVSFYTNNNNVLSLNAAKNITFNNLPFPSLTDVDQDGDIDMLVGVYGSESNRILYYQNSGNGTFTQITGANNPFINTPVSLSPNPSFYDYDQDGDKDLFLGDRGLRGDASLADIRLIQNTSKGNLIKFGNIFIRFAIEQKDTSPAFIDIDNDQDLDLFLGNSRGQVIFYENENGVFNQNDTDNPLKSLPLTQTERVAPRFVNVDNDGDVDLYLGLGDGFNSGSVQFYRNNSGVFTKDDAGNALSSVTGVGYVKPAFVDLDKDGDLDVFVGGFEDGLIRYFSNNNGVYTQQNDANNPLSSNVIAQKDSSYFAPVFVDLDVDGDKDAVIAFTSGEVGIETSTLRYFKNNGSGVLTEATGANNPFDGLILDKKADPAFADLDLDGDMDLYIGEDGIGRIIRGVQVFENLSPSDIEISVGQNVINNGGTFNFGLVNTGSSSDTTFTIKNAGASNLILTGIPTITGDLSAFTVNGNFSDPVIASGQTLSFAVTFTPNNSDIKTLNISFASNDPDETPYSLTIKGNDPTTGIFELHRGKLKIFPNPTNDRVQISLENTSLQNYKLSIYDLNGRQWYQENNTGTGIKANPEIDLTNLPQGIYLLRMEIAGQVITERIVID